MMELAPFAEAAVRTATPLLIAAAGETITERAGVINIGLEGCMIAGAYAAFVFGGTHPALGYAAAALGGASMGLLLAIFSIALRRDQVMVGTAVTMLGLGLTSTLFRARGEVLVLGSHVQSAVTIPFLSDLPVVGKAFFAQPPVAYAAFILVPLVWWFLRRTHAGLALRAVGESASAARASGIPVGMVQAAAVLAGSTLAGIGGGALVIAQAGSFAEGMSAGRGFLALAIVALGRWRPWGVAVAALAFGAAMALQFVVQAFGWGVRYELVLMIPYVLTLIALAAFGRGVAPAMLGRSPAEG